MYDEYRSRVAGTTIDGATLLSTDYFNTFNEVIMLLGMLPEMPEMIEEIDAWRFRTYEEHFGDSHLPFAVLAIEAYAHLPPAIRDRFEQTLAQMRDTVDQARGILGPLAGRRRGAPGAPRPHGVLAPPPRPPPPEPAREPR